ncbi:gamma-glutamyl kinase [Aliiroseovarius sp. YM-037]|uniref:gamma-glutamyl kinase n=1 Tax=Aliiroseovarius sp. YM-037 TaxID=3341728 RepID=UPI003A7FE441
MVGELADVSMRHPPRLKHTPAQAFHKTYHPLFFPKNSKNLTTVAVMREPIDWLGSWYRYRSRDALVGSEKSTRDVSFDAFINAYLADERPAYADLGSQGRFLCGNGDVPKVDQIFDFTQLDRLRCFFEERLGRQLTLRPVNVSPKFELQLTTKTEARLRKELAHDFALYEKIRQ